MYFDLRPKERKEDLYDRERELSLLVKSIQNCEPLVLILGLRRTGKTSLLKVGLNVVDTPKLIVDCRIFEREPTIPRGEFIGILEREVNRAIRSGLKELIEFLKTLEGVSVLGNSVKFSRGKSEKVLVADLLSALNDYAEEQDTCFVFALDEVQELSKLRGLDLTKVFAYCYDNLRNLILVLTGSKIGLVFRFLKLDDPKSPLYGRAAQQILLNNFNEHQSLEFLREGFRQAGIDPPQSVLEEAVDRLDGVVGWLTYFGALSIREGVSRRTLEKVVEIGSKLVRQELENFLSTRSESTRKRYLLILERIAEYPASWSEIKRHLEAKGEYYISDSNLSLLLRQLIDAGFLTKTNGEYSITDPLLTYAIRKGSN